MNSPLEPFDGPTPFGMILPVIVIAVALVLIVKLFELIFSFIEDEGKFPDTNKPHTLTFGSSKYAPTDFFEKFLDFVGLPRLEYPFADNINRGVRLFFGLPIEIDLADGDSWLGLLDALLNIMTGPGYYLVICKQVARDFEQVNEAFDSFEIGFGPSFITSVVKLFEAFTTSVTFRFFVRMAELGNRYAIFKYNRASTSGRRVHSGQVKKFPVFRRERTFYTRMQSNVPGRGIMAPTSLSAYWSVLMGGGLIGVPVASTAKAMPSPSDLANFQDESSKLPALMPNGRELNEGSTPTFFMDALTTPEGKMGSRIPTEVIQHFERDTNAEFCPFYIHDIRTNEIVHIPSFITSIDESFSADYNETEGYGRTDPVRTYSKTSRSISLSFKLVATSEDDHELMWYMVNRLVAMLYPSRDRGRQLIDSTGEITHLQPFSQVPTESPLVRLRLGNIFHTNYSTKAFARMMGFPHAMTTQLKKRLTEKDIDLENVRNNLGELIRSAGAVFKERAWILLPEGKDPFLDEGKLMTLLVDAGKETENLSCAAGTNRDCLIHAGTKVKLVAVPQEVGGLAAAAAAVPVPGNDAPKPPKSIVVTTQADFNGTLISVKRLQVVTPMPTADDENATIRRNDDSALFESIEFESSTGGDALMNTVFGKAGVSFAKAANAAKFDVNFEVSLGLGKLPSFKLEQGDIERAIPAVAPKIFGTDVNDIVANFKKVTDAIASEQSKLNNLVKNHPMYRAFETTKGKGLAGFITQMSLNYSDSKWDLRPGNVAPQYLEINLSFAPIHDLTPGIDSRGMMIAPTHPVGVLKTDPYQNAKKELNFDRSTHQELIEHALKFGTDVATTIGMSQEDE